MAGLRAGGTWTRALWALVLAALLGLRLLMPPGFMPEFDHGAVTITICPDAVQASAPLGHDHHGGHSKALHQPCSYASAPPLGTSASAAWLPDAPIAFSAPPLIARLFPFVERHRARDRPPLRGPPIPV